MAWINYTSGNLSAFKDDYPDAVVVVSENDVMNCVYNGQEAGRFIKVLALSHQKVTEYRGLTRASAENLAAGVAAFGKKDLVVKVGYTVTPLNILQDAYTAYFTARCGSLLGSEVTCAISRANEADGYTLTVTESTTRWGHVDPTTGETVYDEVIGEQQVFETTGAGSATRGDVRISWGHSA